VSRVVPSRKSNDRSTHGLKPLGRMLSVTGAQSALKEAGARMTAQRLAVLSILEGNRTHPTAEAIVRQVQGRLGYVSPATIYNTLDSLEKIGMVRRIEGLEPKTHFDPDTSPHQHAICRVCGRVFDIDEVPVVVPEFQVQDIVVHGVCAKCTTRDVTNT